jgi:hypothetical protein
MQNRYNPVEAAERPSVEASPRSDAPNAPTAPTALKKVSFGSITKKKEASTKTVYPVAPDPSGENAIIAARIVERLAAFEALESALEVDKKDLIARNKSFYFMNAHGKVEVPSSIAIPYENGEVLVTFTSRYKALPDESSVAAILGENVGEHFRQAFEIKIDGDKLPVDKAQELIEKLQELFGSYNALDALSNKETVKPNADFHAKRHLVLSTAQNVAIDEACPMVCMVKTKGRK